MNRPVVKVPSLTVRALKGSAAFLEAQEGSISSRGEQNTKWKYSCNVKHAAYEETLDSPRLSGQLRISCLE